MKTLQNRNTQKILKNSFVYPVGTPFCIMWMDKTLMQKPGILQKKIQPEIWVKTSEK